MKQRTPRRGERRGEGAAMTELSPEQQLHNVASRLVGLTTPVDEASEPGEVERYAASKIIIAHSARQLAEMVLAHLDGALKTLEWDEDEPPF